MLHIASIKFKALPRIFAATIPKMNYLYSYMIRGVRQQERVGAYCGSMKQILHSSAKESRGLEYVATFLIS